jgi:Flp pilus assembly protein TadD
LVLAAPGWPAGRVDLGSVLFELGATGPAVAELERAVRLDPDLARAHDYLGRALSAEGRRPEAEAHLRRAAELRGQPWPPADRPGTPGAPAAPRP